MKAMKGIVEARHGATVNEVLCYYGIKHFPNYFLAELEKMWGMCRGSER
jgi:hypothetical protein